MAGTLALFLVGASAPSPLYVIYQGRFGFSAGTLTAIFAVYALALLAALLFAGSLSDRAGRRPVVLLSLGVQAISCILFLLAQDVETLYAARIVQGLATGIATGALSAALIDLQPDGTTFGPLAAAVAPSAGLATGALGAGVLVQVAPLPLRLVFWVQLAAIALAAALVATRVPETVRREAQPWRALRLQVRIPTAARRPFLALSPGLVATWALAALYLSLGPSLAVMLLHSQSHVLGGLIPATLCATTAVSAGLARSWTGHRAVLLGTGVFAVGVAVTLIGIRVPSTGLLFAGTAIAGLGFGPAFAGILRTLTPLSPPDGRAGLLSAVYLVSYLAFSVPAVLAGLAVTRFGLRDTASVYAAAVIALALLAGLASARRGPAMR